MKRMLAEIVLKQLEIELLKSKYSNNIWIRKEDDDTYFLIAGLLKNKDNSIFYRVTYPEHKDLLREEFVNYLEENYSEQFLIDLRI